MKRTVLPIIVALAAMYLYSLEQGSPASTPGAATHSASTEVPALVGGRQVEASGTVVRVLSDDNDGSRHQRFILELANGHTLLIAHNIDLALRVPNLKSSDTVHFSGQYEDNDRGGVVHWTHHDPQQQHIGGWLQHNGNVYE